MLSGLTRPANLTEQQAITQANVVRSIRNREGYDPHAIEEYFGIAALLSTGDGARELQALFSAANPHNPAKVYGQLKRLLVEIKSVTFPNTSTAIVRFRYTDTPIRNEWRFDNPLGFQVYSYRRDQETVSPGEGDERPFPDDGSSYGLCLSSVQAAQMPKGGSLDARVTSVTYQENNVVQVFATYGISTMVIFDEDEKFETISLGYTESWQVVPAEKGNILFVKPIAKDSN